jgi:IPT/TIG domain-containing protein
VLERDVLQSRPLGTVEVEPAQAPRGRAPLEITAISPPFAAAGELVRIYGKGFDAIEGNAPDGGCADIPASNRCDAPTGNCVVVDGQPVDVVAVTPTMLVFRAPFSCVAPVRIEVRNGHARGIARAPFCRLP